MLRRRQKGVRPAASPEDCNVAVFEAHASRKLNEGRRFQMVRVCAEDRQRLDARSVGSVPALNARGGAAGIILPFCSATVIVICDRSTCMDRDSPDSCKTMPQKCIPRPHGAKDLTQIDQGLYVTTPSSGGLRRNDIQLVTCEQRVYR